jgi:hypothetical protein
MILLEPVLAVADFRVLGSQIFPDWNIHLIKIVPIACLVFSFQKSQLVSMVQTHFRSKDLINERRSMMEKIVLSSHMWELVRVQPTISLFDVMRA